MVISQTSLLALLVSYDGCLKLMQEIGLSADAAKFSCQVAYQTGFLYGVVGPYINPATTPFIAIAGAITTSCGAFYAIAST
jgi:hypothetical protein